MELRHGRLTCLLGPNGSGKTTLLRTLTGTLPPLAGRVELAGDDLARLDPTQRARRLGVVLTGGVDAGLLRAGELVALGRHPHTGWSGRLGPADWDAVAWALAATGATELTDRRVAQLSDGERQRVLIARALAQQPEVLALDEPTAFVDLPRRAELAELLAHLARECGLAVLLTSHDLDLALRAADDVWLIEAGGHEPGTLHVGAPEDLARSGAVARAFVPDEEARVRFDDHRGAFVAGPPPLATVTVEGPDPDVRWAARAVERAGGEVVDGSADLAVRCHARGWELSGEGTDVSGEGVPGAVVTGATFGELAEAVRAALPRLARRDESARR